MPETSGSKPLYLKGIPVEQGLEEIKNTRHQWVRVGKQDLMDMFGEQNEEARFLETEEYFLG